MSSAVVDMSYDVAENIVFMSFPHPVELNSRAEINDHFDRVIAFWRGHTAGRKAYFVVDFENITINVSELAYYAAQTKRAHEICAITSVRYGGNPLQRAATRLAGMKNQQPSNIYETREQALAAVRGLKKGAKVSTARATPSK
jgi:hypothetical protein